MSLLHRVQPEIAVPADLVVAWRVATAAIGGSAVVTLTLALGRATLAIETPAGVRTLDETTFDAITLVERDGLAHAEVPGVVRVVADASGAVLYVRCSMFARAMASLGVAGGRYGLAEGALDLPRLSRDAG